MSTGMLWFDDSAKPLTEKIVKAIAYYKEKYKLTPDLCLVHPNMLNGFVQHEGNQLVVEGVKVRAYRPVLPGHLWFGMDEPDPRA